MINCDRWALFGYTTREEALAKIEEKIRENWTVESFGVNADPIVWHREFTEDIELQEI